MPKFKPFILILLSVFVLTFVSPFFLVQTCAANSAKQQYLTADSCYKKLRNSAAKRKKASEWLKCIKKYETIYKVYPNSSWAPAGMYKAAELYLTLARLSGRHSYKNNGMDLLARIQNRYPRSAYNKRAKSLQARNTNRPPKTVSKKRSKPTVPVASGIPHKKALKKKTQKLALINQFNREQRRSKPVKPSPATPEPPLPVQVKPTAYKPPKGDSTVTELRFWSNPEYTRIVVNATDERDYSHRLLKKDPDIDKPFQRLYVDIEQSRLGPRIAEHTPINDNLLRQARAGQYLPHTVRVVVDIKDFENYKIFSLKDPFRIVIDVWGKGSNGSPSTSPSGPRVADTDSPPSGGKTRQFDTDNLKSSDIARQLALGVRKIVIDPGHGGPDPGAPGYYKNVWEKDIVLKIAKKLATNLRDRLKCTVILTRSKDKKLTLEERTAIANTQRADLFISLHCNAAKNRKLRGIETYILNLATDEQAIAVAARENATSEKNISDLEYILSDLMKHAKVEESTRLANVVHAAFIKGMKKKYSGIKDLGVKRAPFYVLLGARMPSILIEASFLSNPEECKRLMTSAYQSTIASSIADGVVNYINETNPKQL